MIEVKKRLSDSLDVQVQKGLSGKNDGIPMGFNRLNKYIGIRKSMYFLLGGLTGSGKTSLLDDAFVLNHIDWFLSPEGQKSGIKLEIIYRSMERNKDYKFAKWISRKIFIDQGLTLPIGKILGWNGQRMTPDEHDLYKHFREYIDNMEGILTLIDGAENPIGITKHIKEHALKNGEDIDEYNKIYLPNDPNKITIVVTDHVGLLKLTKDLDTKKKTIDKMSDEFRYARDMYGYTIVALSQFNRDISNPIRIKNGDVEPQLEDFKDSASTQEDADVVLALFDPLRYKVEDPNGYDLDKLFDPATGDKFFRSLRLIKNSYGADDIRIGLAFNGEVGMFKELKRLKDMTDSDYESIRNKTYFLQQ
jgi:hypothetical protein